MKKQNKRLWATKVEELLVFHWIWLDLFDSKWNYCFNFLMLFNFPFNFLYKIHSHPTKILTSVPLLQQTQNFHRKLCLFLICHLEHLYEISCILWIYIYPPFLYTKWCTIYTLLCFLLSHLIYLGVYFHIGAQRAS